MVRQPTKGFYCIQDSFCLIFFFSKTQFSTDINSLSPLIEPNFGPFRKSVMTPSHKTERIEKRKKTNIKKKKDALAGNRTRASRVAGENSTTEPPVPLFRTGRTCTYQCKTKSGLQRNFTALKNIIKLHGDDG